MWCVWLWVSCVRSTDVRTVFFKGRDIFQRTVQSFAWTDNGRTFRLWLVINVVISSRLNRSIFSRGAHWWAVTGAFRLAVAVIILQLEGFGSTPVDGRQGRQARDTSSVLCTVLANPRFKVMPTATVIGARGGYDRRRGRHTGKEERERKKQAKKRVL